MACNHCYRSDATMTEVDRTHLCLPCLFDAARVRVTRAWPHEKVTDECRKVYAEALRRALQSEGL